MTQRVVCILGMHRSGTSVITRILNLLGVDLGPEARLQGPRPDNPRGFWEHEPFVRIDDDILSRFGGSWSAPPAFPPGWERGPDVLDLRARARIAAAESCAVAALWGWKDPRACLTLPFWQAVLPPMHYVICFRSVVEVARSLERREGFTLERGARLWVAHVAAAAE